MGQVIASVEGFIKQAEDAYKAHDAKKVIHYCTEALRNHPGHPRALSLAAQVYLSLGEYDRAAKFFEMAVNAEPNNIEHFIYLSKVLRTQSLGGQAVKVMEIGIQQNPDNPDGHATLLGLFLYFNHAHIVPDYIDNLPEILKNNTDIQQYLCFALKLLEKPEEAEIVYQKAKATGKVTDSFGISFEFNLPRVFKSREQIAQLRTKFKESLDYYAKRKLSIDLQILTSSPVFQLAFQNENNKELAKEYVKLLRRGAKELNYVAPHCKQGITALKKANEPIRIGFISRHMHEHSVGRCYRNLLPYLQKTGEFDVTLFMLENKVDEKIEELSAANVHIHKLSKNNRMALETLALSQLDIAVFPDLGMDAGTHYVAMGRVAPKQVCLTGHPDTTGIDTIDYFISSRYYEPEDGASHYTERLLQTDGMDTLFDRPLPPKENFSRAALGLPEDKKLYVCPMAIQKMHPDFDDFLAGILEKDPNGMIVLFKDFQLKSAGEVLRERVLQKCDPDRVIFMEWLSSDKFVSVLKETDVILDSIYFGAGTTSQISFGYGVPIVTMPGKFARGRMVAGYYKLMGIKDAPVARSKEEYVSLAFKLANDKAYKASISTQLLEKNRILFEENDYGARFAQMMQDILRGDVKKYQL